MFYLWVIPHLRYPLGWDEGRGLNVSESGLGQLADEADLDLGWDNTLLILEPVSGTDLNNPDSGGQCWAGQESPGQGQASSADIHHALY